VRRPRVCRMRFFCNTAANWRALLTAWGFIAAYKLMSTSMEASLGELWPRHAGCHRYPWLHGDPAVQERCDRSLSWSQSCSLMQHIERVGKRHEHVSVDIPMLGSNGDGANYAERPRTGLICQTDRGDKKHSDTSCQENERCIASCHPLASLNRCSGLHMHQGWHLLSALHAYVFTCNHPIC
jgi:hypothetical protein